MARRIKAARALAGLKSTKALAERTGEGLGDKTLRKFESETDAAEPDRQQLLRIAGACEVHIAFFEFDLNAVLQAEGLRRVHATLYGENLEGIEEVIAESLAAVASTVARDVRKRAAATRDPAEQHERVLAEHVRSSQPPADSTGVDTPAPPKASRE